MKNYDLEAKGLTTPAFIYDEAAIASSCHRFNQVCHDAGIDQLFPIKCHNVIGSLQIIAEYVSGFAASSLFEAQLSREVLGHGKKLHVTSPGLRDDDLDALLSLCDGFSFNSLSQWARLKESVVGRVTCGLRINPQLPFVSDARYNPCRPQSRLGAPLNQVKQALSSHPCVFDGIEGVHFHTNCDSTDWLPLLKTIKHLDANIPALLQQCRWINLGGGYLLEENTDLSPFKKAVQLLQDKYDLEVIFEPGAGVVRDACVLVARVVDMFTSDGAQIVVLDTTVNHMPEVFEYGFSPDVLDDKDDGRHCYMLTGATCLAGDVFGEYAFDTPLEVGAKITFTGVGAYSLVKSHTFNGVNLPTIYALKPQGELKMQKQYSYEEFRLKSGLGTQYETVRNVVAPARGIGQRKSA